MEEEEEEEEDDEDDKDDDDQKLAGSVNFWETSAGIQTE